MTTKMEQLKQKMKVEYEKKADEYFSKYEELKKSGKFNIDGIEMLLGDGIAATKEVLIETIEEMIKQEMSAETNGESKKNVFLRKNTKAVGQAPGNNDNDNARQHNVWTPILVLPGLRSWRVPR